MLDNIVNRRDAGSNQDHDGRAETECSGNVTKRTSDA